MEQEGAQVSAEHVINAQQAEINQLMVEKMKLVALVNQQHQELLELRAQSLKPNKRKVKDAPQA